MGQSNLNHNDNLFFSTTWCRDRLYTSSATGDLLKFYDTFRDNEDLLEWMRERPKGAPKLVEIEGRKDIVIVIPTADVNGMYAKNCRENIFKGSHIIFVCSSSPKDPYFNYSHYCNAGIRKALEYDPKWVILSNDDMIKVDEIGVLIEQLNKIDSTKVEVVFAGYPKLSLIGKERSIVYIIFSSLHSLIMGEIPIHKMVLKVRRRFNIKLYTSENRWFYKLLLTNRDRYIFSDHFTIYSASFVRERNGRIFDETFINGYEDHDLFIRIKRDLRFAIVNYKIKPIVGATLGNGPDRTLKHQVNLLLLQKRYLKSPGKELICLHK